MKANKFSNLISNYDGVMPFQVAVPPRTKIEISVPKDSFRSGEDAGILTIRMGILPVLGYAYTATITTKPFASGPGAGYFRKYAGLTKDRDKELFTYIYEVTVKTETNSIRVGDPMMEAYRQWIDKIVELLRDQLEDERIFERNRKFGCLLTDEN